MFVDDTEEDDVDVFEGKFSPKMFCLLGKGNNANCPISDEKMKTEKVVNCHQRLFAVDCFRRLQERTIIRI